jgi:hypothetical protein
MIISALFREHCWHWRRTSDRNSGVRSFLQRAKDGNATGNRIYRGLFDPADRGRGLLVFEPADNRAPSAAEL